MANCAIYIKGSDAITYFLRDCIQSGRNFRGSNGSVTGVKEHLFDTKWTDDIVEPILDKDGNQIGWNKAIPDLSAAKLYQGRVVSTPDDVNAVTRELIAERYPLSDENKLMRLKLSGDDTGWDEYQLFVTNIVNQGRDFKKLMEAQNGGFT